MIAGEVTAIDGDRWTINGAEVQVPDAALLEGELGLGEPVRAVGAVNEDGALLAMKVKSAPLLDPEALLVGQV